jgi:hypothetical protein
MQGKPDGRHLMDYRLAVVGIPVSDVDDSIDSYVTASGSTSTTT